MFKLAAFLKPFKKECIIGPAFKLLEAILELLLPTMMAFIINNGVAAHNTSYVLEMGGVMLLMSILGFGSSLVCQYFAARASQGFGTTLRNAVFGHVSTLSYAEIDQFGTASLINRITNDVNQLQVAVAMLIRLVIRAPFICVGALIMAMILDFRLSLVLLAAIPVFAVILYFIISRTSPLYRKYQQKLDRITLVLRENLSGVRVIRAFAKAGQEKKRFDLSNEDLTQTAIRVGKISSLLNPLTSAVMNAAIIAILWVGGIHINAGRLSQGEIIAFVNYITQILLALIVVSNLVIIFTRAYASAGRINEVLDTQTSVPDAGCGSRKENFTDMLERALSQAGKGKDQVNPVKRTPVEETTSGTAPFIEFRNVSFGYSQTGDLALTNVSAVIGRGETVGIIGGTGSGKSTFVNLIPRFYDVTDGEILLDGVNMKNIPIRQLRQKIGMVQQKAVLFTGTVAENIRWGNQDASDEEIAKAAVIAQAHEFISELPGQYQAGIARGGANLSGGQKQRLTIARAIAARPRILILDDATSALDFATEAVLRMALRQDSADRTVLIVTQRASTVRYADRIIVFDDGCVAGVGTHDELLAGCSVYREIWLSQISGEEAAQ